jgi:hypothetical protein
VRNTSLEVQLTTRRLEDHDQHLELATHIPEHSTRNSESATGNRKPEKSTLNKKFCNTHNFLSSLKKEIINQLKTEQ